MSPYKFHNAKTNSQTQRGLEVENYLNNYISFKPKFHQNSWFCDLQTNKNIDFSQIYETIVNLYKPVSIPEQVDFFEDIELPTHIIIWSNLHTSNKIIESTKIKTDFYFKFSQNSNKINFNLNNLFLNINDKSFVNRHVN